MISSGAKPEYCSSRVCAPGGMVILSVYHLEISSLFPNSSGVIWTRSSASAAAVVVILGTNSRKDRISSEWASS